MNRALLAAGLTVMVTAALLIWWVVEEPRRIVRSILSIEELPATTWVVRCESPFTTDVLTGCYLEIDPREFPRLLAGLPFESRVQTGHTHDYHQWRNIGENFEISTEYVVHPKEYKYGGHIMVITNAERSRAIVDLYIE